MSEPKTTGPIDTVDAILREYLGSITATSAAIKIVLALRRNGHLREKETTDV